MCAYGGVCIEMGCVGGCVGIDHVGVDDNRQVGVSMGLYMCGTVLLRVGKNAHGRDERDAWSSLGLRM